MSLMINNINNINPSITIVKQLLTHHNNIALLHFLCSFNFDLYIWIAIKKQKNNFLVKLITIMYYFKFQSNEPNLSTAPRLLFGV